MALGATTRVVGAQDTTQAAGARDTMPAAGAEDTTRAPVSCDGQRVDDIIVDPAPPPITGIRRVHALASVVTHLHATTHESVIRRFLLLTIGKPCTELRRAESERLLRAQPYLAEASVQAFPDARGGVTILVRTVDEYSVIATGQVESRNPFVESARLGSANVDGAGILAAGEWRSGGVYRNGFGGEVIDNQFAGRPYIVSLLGRQDPLGSEWRVEASHPFYTDLQRVAWRALAGGSDSYVAFEPVRGIIHGLHVAREYFDVGGIVRIGPPGRLSLFGASFSQDRELPGRMPVLITDSGLVVDSSSALWNRYAIHRIARVNALWGVRDIGFVRGRGLDALRATQDVPIGFQLGTMFGRSLTALGSRDDDIFMSADLYLGIGSPHDLFRLQFQGEARRDNSADLWDGILTSGRAAHYLQLTENETIVTSAEWSGGWRMRTPFALTLGDYEGGVRGYGFLTVPGGQRAVVRLEDRHFIGTMPRLADIGVAAFVDAGRLWAGDVPFGETLKTRASIGFSILAALPPHSARMWRVDFAMPQTADGQHRLEVRVSNVDRTTFFWQEPRDVQSARERTVPSSIYSWP